ncbi:MAG TPA: hypothetical protein VFT99_17580 [Roseiflexaceae bacterium]|nr:hypothetical protein [Roseiflexaceae bacterium]
MSKQTPRGRAVASRKSSMRMFYILLGVIAVAGLAFLATTVLQNRQPTAAAPTPAGPAPQAPEVPVGQTTDGFWYKGNADARVTITEYADYQ